MPRLAILLAAAAILLGLPPVALAQARPSNQLATIGPTPLVPPAPTPFSGFPATATPFILGTPGVPPLPRTTSVTVPRPNLVATATAAVATITVADATATASVAAPLTAVAQTATALAIPTRTATVVLSSPTALASPTPLATATPVRTNTPTALPTTAPLTPTAVPTPDLLATSRTVQTRAPIAVGDDTISAGAALQIPLETPLEDGAIPPGTPVRLPNGQVITLPAGTSIPAAESPTTIGAPLNAVLTRTGLVGDTTYPQGTALVLPSGTSVLGSPEANDTVLLQAGAVVQVAGRTVTLIEPLPVVVSPAPVAQPAALPPTGEADPVWWPAGLGLVLMLGGWRLLRRT
ncbi:MAG TPA: hypothetical protein VII06_24280 [Chloroflexota bacterium]|jgi:hypothetical protein